MPAESSSLISTFLILLAGLGVVLLCKRYLHVNSGAVLLGALFAPAILFLGLSGRLVEFKGLGLEAKFQQAASSPITLAHAVVKPNSPSASSIQERSAGRAYLGVGSEVVLLPAPSADKPITRQDVLDYAMQIYPGLFQGNFELLVIHDSENRVLGYFPRNYFFDLFRIEFEQTDRGTGHEYDSKRVGEQLEQTQLWDLVEHPRLRADTWGFKTTLRTTDTNAQALSIMDTTGLDSIVVVDNKGTYAGFVRRKDIVAELLLTLTEKK